MNKAPGSGRPCSGKTKIVEIIGPAGAGKTTLYQALDRYPESVRLENFPDVRKIGDAPFFVSHGIQLIPPLLSLYRPDSRQLTRREFAWMAILHGWSALLRRQAQDGRQAIVLDQGSVYLLAEMRLSGPGYLQQESAVSFWQAFYSCWSATLDMILWLDASDEILLDRIRNRRQELIVKDQPASVVYKYLDRYRTEYEFILSHLTAKNACLKVLKFDTGRQQPQDILNQFLSELHGAAPVQHAVQRG